MMILNLSASCLLLVAAYQPVKTGLKFDHAAHVTSYEIECTSCHSVAESEKATDNNIPGHEICSDCHTIGETAKDCGLCHTNADDPSGVTLPDFHLNFSHKRHLEKPVTSNACLRCHAVLDMEAGTVKLTEFPAMQDCFACHDGFKATVDCAACHTRAEEVKTLVHEPDWKHEHKYSTDLGGANCMPCHQAETFCSGCHAGDNIVETVHELNFRETHGIEARENMYLCQSCHDPESFCTSCHAQEGAMPFDHTVSGWASPPYRHADVAQEDLESCASCHSTESPVCARCHFDTDGIRGTNPPIHYDSIDELEKGPWHDDPGFQCFTCHIDTRTAGVGFCGYCHGAED